MIETYAFLAVFTLQILAMSVLHPAWFTRYLRVKMERYSAEERFAQLHPRTEREVIERLLTRYRVLNAGIAVVGLMLMYGLFNYMRRSDWSDGPVEALVSVYAVLQVIPLILAAVTMHLYNSKALQRSLAEGKRKAILKRRVLFDFVSPFTVFLAVLGYILFAAFVIYIDQDPFYGFAGPLINIGTVTLIYALLAFVVYTKLYGRRSHPFETRDDRMRWIGVTVKVGVYSCIACVVFLSLNFTLVLLDLQRWEPFAQSLFFVISAILCSAGLVAPPGRSDAVKLVSTPMP